MTRIESLPYSHGVGHSFAPEADPILLRMEDIPLAHKLPPSSERRVNHWLLGTAGHEANHALLALELGVRVKEISVIPQGNILGTTVFEGPVSDNHFRIIAAGGAVDPKVGRGASGYGGDLGKIAMLDILSGRSGGTSINSSISQAGLILGRYPSGLRERIAEIIAFLGKVDGDLFVDIIDRAKLEISLERQGRGDEISCLLKGSNLAQKESEYLGIEPTREYRHNPVIRLIFETESGDEVHLKCAICGGVDVHHPNCQVVVKDLYPFGIDLEIKSPGPGKLMEIQ